MCSKSIQFMHINEFEYNITLSGFIASFQSVRFILEKGKNNYAARFCTSRITIGSIISYFEPIVCI